MRPLFPHQFQVKGRGVIDPSRPEPTSQKGLARRIARIEPGEEGFGPLLAASPQLVSLLALICVAQNLRDGIALARLTHQAESLLDSLGWDWGDARTIINPQEP